MNLKIRKYSAQYKKECLDIFDSNSDVFFTLSEREAFSTFLDESSCHYLVFLIENKIIACSGYHISEEGIGTLCWGMVERRQHNNGIGLQMTRYRIDAMKKRGAVKITMNTSQHTVGFYKKLGFVVISVTKNGYGENLDKIDLEYQCEK